MHVLTLILNYLSAIQIMVIITNGYSSGGYWSESLPNDFEDLRFLVEMSTYPHFDWLDSQTVTLSVSKSGRVRVCRIGRVTPNEVLPEIGQYYGEERNNIVKS